MKTRLFRIFLLMSMLPTAVVLLLQWPISERYMSVLDSRGLNESQESALDLARWIIDDQLQEMQTFAAATLAKSGEADLRLEYLGEGRSRPLGPTLEDSLAAQLPESGEYARRLGLGESEFLVVSSRIGDQHVMLAKRLDARLAGDVRSVTVGGSRLRQIHLYYRNLQRYSSLVLFLGLGAFLMLASLLLSRRLARQISHPLQKLSEGARTVAAGNLDHRVDVEAPDEIGELVDAFNTMTAELADSKEELVRAERVAAWQGVARRLAHEIKNPLTPITLAMHRISSRSDDEAIREAVATVLEEADNLKRLASEFSEYARMPQPEIAPVDLAELVRGVCALYVPAERIGCRQDFDGGPHQVMGDAGMLRQVIANLTKNAVAAMGASGELTIGLYRDATRLILTVTDDGPGLPDPVEQVFAPYYTTRAAGTGLGLAIARKIAEDHGGRLVAQNHIEGGAVFRLELPLQQES